MRKRPKAGDAKSERRSTNLIIWVIAAFVVIVMVISAFNVPYSDNDDATSEATNSETRFDIFYLHGAIGKGTYLRPSQPGDNATYKTTLNSTFTLEIGRSMIDRKYNPEIKPAVNIYINSLETKGIIVNFRIEFYLFEGNFLPDDPVSTAIFNNYTTKGSSSPEYIQLTSTKYQDDPPEDMPAGEFGGSVRLKIWRTDNIDEVDLEIYCGADAKISWIQVPYDKSLSSTQKDDDDKSTPMGSGALLVMAITAGSLVVYYRKYGKV